MSLEPSPGLVVRFDYLWLNEKQSGLESGKDRPCAIILSSAERPDGSKLVLLCAITHSPPQQGEAAVKIPATVAHNLGLDDEQSWIKTDEVNRLIWEKGRIPYGISQARKGQWSFGVLPHGLGALAHGQLLEKAKRRTLQVVDRSDGS